MTMKIKDVSTPPKGVLRDDFEAWLVDGHTRRERVGNAESVTGCPIGNWLRDKKIMTHPQVLGAFLVNYDTNTRGRRWEHPAWVREFVKKIDDLGIIHITAGRALDTLALCA